MGFQTDLMTGVAQLLAAESIGTWNTTGAYTASQTGIVLRTIPSNPDRIIVLSTYGVSDDPSLSDSVEGLQVVTRWGGGDPRPNDDLADLIFNALHARHGYDLATDIHVTQSLRRSSTSLGQDANQRWRTSQNFYLDVHRPSAHRS